MPLDAILAHIDAHRHAILACVNAPALAVRATVAPDGSVAFAAHNDDVSAPETKCLRIALGQLSVEARGATGIVVHPIER